MKPVRIIQNTEKQEKNNLIINPSDISALEEAFKLKEQAGGKITIMTMGVDSCEPLLRQQLAKGCDEAILLTDTAFAGSDTLATANILSHAIKKLCGFDIILCGIKSADGETGQVGPELAVHLNMPYAGNCFNIHFKEDKLECFCLSDDSIECLQLPIPALLTIQNGINSPRLASLTGLYKAKRATIKKLDHNSIDIDVSKCGLKGSATVVLRTSKHLLEKRQAIHYYEHDLPIALKTIKEVINGTDMDMVKY